MRYLSNLSLGNNVKETEVKARNANVFEEVEGEVTSINSTEKNDTDSNFFTYYVSLARYIFELIRRLSSSQFNCATT